MQGTAFHDPYNDKPLASEHEPSDALLAHWNPPAQPSFYVYAELGSLLSAEIIQRLLTSALAVAKSSPGVIDCVEQVSHATKEAAAAGTDVERSIFSIGSMQQRTERAPESLPKAI